MAKTLMGSMSPANIGPNSLRVANQAGVVVNRRHERGIGTNYMRQLGSAALLRDAPTIPQEADTTNEDFDKELTCAEAAGSIAAGELVFLEIDELEQDAETPDPVLA